MRRRKRTGTTQGGNVYDARASARDLHIDKNPVRSGIPDEKEERDPARYMNGSRFPQPGDGSSHAYTGTVHSRKGRIGGTQGRSYKVESGKEQDRSRDQRDNGCGGRTETNTGGDKTYTETTLSKDGTGGGSHAREDGGDRRREGQVGRAYGRTVQASAPSGG